MSGDGWFSERQPAAVDTHTEDTRDDGGTLLLLRVEEAALRLQIGRTKMYELVRRGEVESVPIGRLRRIPAECLDEYVHRLRMHTTTDPRPAA